MTSPTNLSVEQRRAIELVLRKRAVDYARCIGAAKGDTARAKGRNAQSAWTKTLGKSVVNPELRTGVLTVQEHPTEHRLKQGYTRFDPVVHLGGFIVFFEAKKSQRADEGKDVQTQAQLLGFGNETAVTTEPGLYCRIYAEEKHIYVWTRKQALAALERKSLLPKVATCNDWTVDWPDA